MQGNRKSILVILIILFLVIGIIVLVRPEWIQKTWQWVVGLAGIVALGFKKLVGFLNGGKALNDISSENEAIKDRLIKIDEEVVLVKERLERERELHKREIEIIEKRISLRETEIKNQEEYLKKIQSLGYKDYLDELPPEERKKLLNDNIIDLP